MACMRGKNKRQKVRSFRQDEHLGDRSSYLWGHRPADFLISREASFGKPAQHVVRQWTSEWCSEQAKVKVVYWSASINDNNHRWRCPVTACRKTHSLAASLRSLSCPYRSGLCCSTGSVGNTLWSMLHKKLKSQRWQTYQYFRDVCSWWLLHHDSPLMLGGRWYKLMNHNSSTHQRLS